jgi:hypothetical protein
MRVPESCAPARLQADLERAGAALGIEVSTAPLPAVAS